MKKIALSIGVIVLGCLQNIAVAQTLATLKAYGKPRPLVATILHPSYEYLGIDVITTQPITCGSTSTSKIRFMTEHLIYNEATYTYPGNSNASFIAVSEIISAAKNGYQIELLSPMTYNATNLVCEVRNYFIYVL